MMISARALRWGLAAMTVAGSSVLAQSPDHRWTFNNTLVDSGTIGGPNAVLIDPDSNPATGGAGTLDANKVSLAGGGNNESAYIELGPGLLSGAPGDVTIELWATQQSVQNWGRVFDFGNRDQGNGQGVDYLLMSWSIGGDGNRDRVEWRDVTPDIGGNRILDDTNRPYTLGTEFHIAMNIRPGAGPGGNTLVTWYSAPSGNPDLGTQRGSFDTPNTLGSLNDENGWLGRSQWAGDATATADYNEMRIFYRNVSPAELESYHDLGPDNLVHPDDDSDGLPKWWENLHSLDDDDDGATVAANGASGDPDGDGADNATEYAAGTDPQDPLSNPNDTDADGLDDSWELDNFGDLLQDGSGDPDFDGSRNEAEETDGTDPNDPGSWGDADGDGMPDDFEVQVWGDTTTASATSDQDGDTYRDVEEYVAKTDPTNGAFSPAKAELLHRWSFNGDLLDSVGGSNAQIVDADNNAGTGGLSDLDTTNPGEVRLFGGAQNNSDHVLLGNNLLGGMTDDVTIEIWATQHGVANWSRVFSFGSGTGDVSRVLMQAWTRGTNINEARIEWRSPGHQTILDTNESPAVYPLGEEHHMLIHLDNDGAGGTNVTLYKGPSGNPDLGLPVGSVFDTHTLADLVDDVNWLGRSQFGGDPTANASYNEVRIYRGLVPPVLAEQFHDQGADDASVTDSDGDCLPDFWELANGLDPNDATGANGPFGDPDGDSVSNRDEYLQGTVAGGDTDGDGLNDAWEVANFGNLSQSGLGDPDGDLADNEAEETAGSDPNDPGSWPDSDVDGLNDAWEEFYFFDLTQVGTGDYDLDAVSNFDEFAAGTDPTDPNDFPDSDGDGLPDPYELATFGNLTASDGTGDLDNDTYSDGEEFLERTDPTDGEFSPSKAKLRHRWSFNGSLGDAVGGSDAQVLDPDNNPGTGGTSDLDITNPGEVRLFGGAHGQSDYVLLGQNLLGGINHDVTLEFWATQHEIQNWSRVFSFGANTNEFIMGSWTRGGNLGESRFEFKDLPGGQSFIDVNENAVFPIGVEHHIVVHYDNDGFGNTQITLFKNPSGDADLGSATGTISVPTTLVDLNDAVDWLGRSQFGGDATANASYNEVRIWNGLVHPKVLEHFHDAGPDDATVADADGDSLPDFWEDATGLDSGDATGDNGPFGDPDGDGVINRDEFVACTPPTNAADSDSDGLNDLWELDNFGDLSQSGDGDPDGDFATNEEEETAGTNPNDSTSFPDSDGDGLPDAFEIAVWGDLTTSDGTGDADDDSYSDLEEYLANTPPNNGNFSPAKAEIQHRWTFNSNDAAGLADQVGTRNAQIIDPDGNPATGGGSDLDTTNPGEARIFGGVNNESDYIDLGPGLLSSKTQDVTIEMWATPHGVQNWGRIFDIGNRASNGNGEDYLLMSWSRGTNAAQDRVEWRDVTPDLGGNILADETNAPYLLGTEYHIVFSVQPGKGPGGSQLVTWWSAPSGSPNLGSPRGSFTTINTLASLNDVNAWLGRSQWQGDATADASWNEVRVYDGFLPSQVLEELHDQGPDVSDLPDSDGDDLPDFWESRYGLAVNDPSGDNGPFGDPDNDGVFNRDEFAAGSDPGNAASTPDDLDADGLPDDWELLSFGTLDQGADDDFDGDCDTNLAEFQAGTDPNNNGDFTDGDGDFLPDSWETKFFGGLGQDQGSDGDADGVGNLDEYFNGTDPTNDDTDGDGLLDGVESNFGFWNGVTDTGTDPLNPDTDGDGLSDGVENPDLPFVDINQPGTDPTFADTDIDGFGDLVEIQKGSDPTDFASIPTIIWHWTHGTLGNGPVTNWTDQNEGVTASVLGPDQGDPTRDADGVFFDGNDALTIPDAQNPLMGLSSWTATVVFRADGTQGEGGATQADGDPNNPDQWWGNSALVGVELPGNPDPSDWGIFLNREHEAVIGSGAGPNPQGYVANGTAYNDGQVHVMTGVFDVTFGTRALYVDGNLINEVGGAGVRGPGGPIHFGVNIPNVPVDRAYYTGRIRDVMLHSQALGAGEVSALAAQLLSGGGLSALVDASFDPGANQMTVSYAGLTAGSDYHVRVSTDGATFVPVPGAEFNAATEDGSFQFPSDEAVTPVQIFRIFEGQTP